MILELPRRAERIGAVRIHDVQKVYELDSGTAKFPTKAREAVATISSYELERINQKMAIVVPVRDERLKLLEGVLSGIPHDCHVIVVSNSRRSPVDRFLMEKQLIKEFNHFVEDNIILIHQQDQGVSDAFKAVGFNSILDNEGKVRAGKAEGVYIGILLAKMLGKEYIGFVDADNYIPGAVREYVEIFAAGFSLAESPYSMVRISWVYKPKIAEERLLFPRWGRVSEVSSQYLNRLVEAYTGFGTEVVKTGNSGEHAMSLKLAELLEYGSGFSLETYEIINILEQFGGILPSPNHRVVSSGVDMFQIETRNPHFHEDKGTEHIKDMVRSSLGAILHSPICPQHLKENILNTLDREESSNPAKMKPPQEIDLKTFVDVLRAKTDVLIEFP
ncbi:MAG: mannosyl-3-phosphoglycerate synthase [Thaumarchaeota archaeon]|nr:mannosyl-3-phosphoglycerate synthase [Nitrososphaerota archaeon]